MADVHRVGIKASPEKVYQALATISETQQKRFRRVGLENRRLAAAADVVI